MENLDSYKFSTKNGFNAVLIDLRYKEISNYYRGESCLELGCADGEGTKLLIPYFEKITAVDGSKKLIGKAKKEIKDTKVEFIHSYFEKLTLNTLFDTILLTHILEHVDNPIEILTIAKKFLATDGIIIVDVPNALSLHRQIGVKLGMLTSVYELNEADKSIGHKRVYDSKSLANDIKAAGLHIQKEGGLFLKPFSNAQMAELLDEKGIQAFNDMGRKYPEIAAEIYVICEV